MIQDIDKKFNNEYKSYKIDDESFVLSYETGAALIRMEENRVFIPKYKDIENKAMEYRYLFSIDDNKYFLSKAKIEPFNDYKYQKLFMLRQTVEKHSCFAAETGYHLYTWYEKNKFCGGCGGSLIHKENSRSLYCEKCKNTIFPTIAPAIIVGVTDGDKILMTKYAGREYKKYALIAGFCEIGETGEDTVRREVFEEVGVRVKNIRYYKSQPWGFDSNMLFGYFAELDGNSNITLDKNELSKAEWISRSEMDIKEIDDDGVSLTREMIGVFKKGLGF